MGGNGNSSGYNGDEEPTPAEPGRRLVSDEARTIVNCGLEYNAIAVSLLNSARLLDSIGGDDRIALLAKLIAEFSILLDATAKARAALVVKKTEATK